VAYLGLVPLEHSSSRTRRQGGTTKAGNGAARRMLIEAAWSYRFPADQPRAVITAGTSGQADPHIAERLGNGCAAAIAALAPAGKLPTVITAAIARELAGFIWAIAKQIQSAAP
jgi:transposase